MSQGVKESLATAKRAENEESYSYYDEEEEQDVNRSPSGRPTQGGIAPKKKSATAVASASEARPLNSDDEGHPRHVAAATAAASKKKDDDASDGYDEEHVAPKSDHEPEKESKPSHRGNVTRKEIFSPATPVVETDFKKDGGLQGFTKDDISWGHPEGRKTKEKPLPYYNTRAAPGKYKPLPSYVQQALYPKEDRVAFEQAPDEEKYEERKCLDETGEEFVIRIDKLPPALQKRPKSSSTSTPKKAAKTSKNEEHEEAASAKKHDRSRSRSRSPAKKRSPTPEKKKEKKRSRSRSRSPALAKKEKKRESSPAPAKKDKKREASPAPPKKKRSPTPEKKKEKKQRSRSRSPAKKEKEKKRERSPSPKQKEKEKEKKKPTAAPSKDKHDDKDKEKERAPKRKREDSEDGAAPADYSASAAKTSKSKLGLAAVTEVAEEGEKIKAPAAKKAKSESSSSMTPVSDLSRVMRAAGERHMDKDTLKPHFVKAMRIIAKFDTKTTPKQMHEVFMDLGRSVGPLVVGDDMSPTSSFAMGAVTAVALVGAMELEYTQPGRYLPKEKAKETKDLDLWN